MAARVQRGYDPRELAVTWLGERLASDLVIDGIIEADALRDELLKRLEFARNRERVFSTRRRDIPPV